MVKAYNKIKHRFLVYSDPKELYQALQDEGCSFSVSATPISLKEKDVEVYRKIAFGVAQCMERLAALLLALDDDGIELMKCS